MLGATLSKEEVDEFMKEADIVSICIVDILKLLYKYKDSIMSVSSIKRRV